MIVLVRTVANWSGTAMAGVVVTPSSVSTGGCVICSGIIARR